MPIWKNSNRNVKLSIGFSAINSFVIAFSFQTVLSGYLFMLAGDDPTTSNLPVGMAEGAKGAMCALFALPTGILADKYGRSPLLKAAAAVAVCAAVVSVAAIAWESPFAQKHRFALMTGALGLWGAFKGMWNSPLESLYADSVPTGNRATLNTLKMQISRLSYCLGPALSIAIMLSQPDTLFTPFPSSTFTGTPDWVWNETEEGCKTSCVQLPTCQGFSRASNCSANDVTQCMGVASRERTGSLYYTAYARPSLDGWSLPQLKLGFLVGAGIAAVAAVVLLCSFTDRLAPGAEEAGHYTTNRPVSITTTQVFPTSQPSSTINSPPSNSSHSASSRSRHRLDQPLLLGSGQARARQPVSRDSYRCCCCCTLRLRHIPYVMVSSDVLFGLSSGMTIKFFPLFFKAEVGLSSVWAQATSIFTYISMAVFSQAALKFSKKRGRIQASLLFQGLGLCCFYIMASLGQFGIVHTTDKNGFPTSYSTYYRTWWVIMPVYVLRTSIMNSTGGLKKAVLMDYVDKKNRAKWNSLDSITQLGWSGSAFLGGYLINRFNYGWTFFITAGMQTCAWALLFLVVPMVPVERPLSTL